MERIFVTRKIPESGLALLHPHFEIDVWEDPLPPPRQTLIARGQGCAGLLTLLSDTIDSSVLDALPSVRAIANFAVGYNNIDIQAATQRKIAIGNTPDVLTDATADIAVGLLIAVARLFPQSADQVRRLQWKTWEPLGLLGQDLSGGKTLGIVGMGRIGQAVAKRCYGGWNMRVLYTSRTERPQVDRDLQATRVSFERLLEQSDFISIHTDLNPSTRHLFHRETLRRMKPNAVLVNTSRGGVIDQNALAEALEQKWIFGAGLDVTDPEPLPDDSALRRYDNCLILPHIGSATFEARSAMSQMAARNLLAALQGQPMPYAVNPIQ